MPNFWDSLKSVGVQAASTAGAAVSTVYQNSLGAFSGVAKDKINQVANGVQEQVGAITKPKNSPPSSTPAQPAPPAPTVKQTAGLGVAGLAIAGAVMFLLLRKK